MCTLIIEQTFLTLRDFGRTFNSSQLIYFGRKGWRFSYVQSEEDFDPAREPIQTTATARFVDFTSPNDRPGSGGGGGHFGNEGYVDDGNFISGTAHNQIWGPMNSRNRKKVAPAWIMVGYGICLNARCGL